LFTLPTSGGHLAKEIQMKFIINEGYEFSEKTVEADVYNVKDGFTTFIGDGVQVFTIKTDQVNTIEAKPEG
jgi:hypothetical protein